MLQVLTVSPETQREKVRGHVTDNVSPYVSASIPVVSLLVRLINVLFGQAGVRVLLQVTSDPVTRVKLVGCVERD